MYFKNMSRYLKENYYLQKKATVATSCVPAMSDRMTYTHMIMKGKGSPNPGIIQTRTCVILSSPPLIFYFNHCYDTWISVFF